MTNRFEYLCYNQLNNLIIITFLKFPLSVKSAIPIPKDRKAVVAGRFYPDTPEELRNEIENLLFSASKLSLNKIDETNKILAIISPHAGYVFSGTVAASGFSILKNNKNIKRVFLLGSSHYAWYEGVSIYFKGYYSTPLGKIEIDSDITSKIFEKSALFNFRLEAHAHEHSLEVQLPFLQYFLGNNFKIIPILIGGHSTEIPRKLANILKPYLGGENLFVISSDLSHYPKYNDAVKVDKNTVEALCSNNTGNFLRQLKENEHKMYENLSTSMCGWTSALTLLYMTEKQKGINFSPVLYQNSGEIPIYGDKSRVVGYQSVLVSQKQETNEMPDHLSDEDKQLLLTLAHNSISKKVRGKEEDEPTLVPIPDKYKTPQGAFVSIYIDNELRGCIGRIESDLPLYKTIEQTAISAATHDTRFIPVKPDELKKMKVEISILTPLKKIDSIDEIIPGKHGILIRKDFRSGTFLPQVATRTGWNAQEMVEECSKHKAGLGSDGWKDADIFTYEAVIISDKVEN